MIIREGRVRIKLDRNVFYNPKMTFCRHLDVLVFKTIAKREKRDVIFLDALAATGVRGIRARVEAGYNSHFNDRDKRAVELITENLKLNGIEGTVYNRDANSLMREMRFTHVDLDPFGSPAEFIDSACSSALKYLSITATDTAALCGSAVESGLKKYSAYVEMTEFYPEVGLRVLIGKIVREATKYDKGLIVLVSWAREHYYRVHVMFRKSVRFAKDMFEKIGYLFYCPRCLNRKWTSMKGECFERCECGGKFIMMGPMWIGELHSKEFVREMIDSSDELECENVEAVRSFLKSIYNELEIPFGFNVHRISKMLKSSPPPMDSIIEKLRENGFSASRVHYSGVVFKTDASIRDVEKLAFDSEYRFR